MQGADVRQQRLSTIAEQDEIYCVWKNSYEECAEKFHKFAKHCPPKVRNYLYGYAESGRLMYQRMVNIACTHMEFIEEDKN